MWWITERQYRQVIFGCGVASIAGGAIAAVILLGYGFSGWLVACIILALLTLAAATTIISKL